MVKSCWKKVEKPGKWVSEALQSAEKAVVEQRIENDKNRFWIFIERKIDLKTLDCICSAWLAT